MDDTELDALLLHAGESWRTHDRLAPPALSDRVNRIVACGDDEVSAAEPGDGAPASGRWPRRWSIAAGAAAAALAAAVAAIVAVSQSSSTEQPYSPDTSAAATTSPGVDVNEQAANDLVDTMFAAIVLPPKAAPTHVSNSNDPQSNRAAGEVFDTRAWTVPMSFTDAVTFLTEHPARGLTPSGSATSSQNGKVQSLGIMYVSAAVGGDADGTMTVSASAAGSGAVVKASLQVKWRPTRPAPEHISGPVDSVDLTFTPDSNSTLGPVHRVVVGSGAQQLANLVNDLPTAFLGDRTGLANDERVVAAFTTAGEVVTVTWGVNGTSFEVGSKRLPALDGSTALTDKLSELLGVRLL